MPRGPQVRLTTAAGVGRLLSEGLGRVSMGAERPGNERTDFALLACEGASRSGARALMHGRLLLRRTATAEVDWLLSQRSGLAWVTTTRRQCAGLCPLCWGSAEALPAPRGTRANFPGMLRLGQKSANCLARNGWRVARRPERSEKKRVRSG
jgi:hypothetical protein